MGADGEAADRGWTARQPDGTPVEALPLRPGTIRRLRAGGVLTLGELRAMGDHELLMLQQFGAAALADVRFLVPAPAVSGEVIMAGRAFTLGAVYAPRRSTYARWPRRLLDYGADGPLPGGRVTVVILPSGNGRVVAGTVWAAWAGEEVAS